uniref:Transmembrane protein n=1 Tax=Graphocephala atropunctata TaxID=36148 RepID=A0A1B6L950_9HEMI
MDSCQIIYLFSMVSYLAIYYSGGSWIHPEDTFSWSRFVFLMAVLMMEEKYELVPPPLVCPPLYMLYKVVAAIIIANIALITVWWQTEDFLKWLVATTIKILEYVPVVGEMVAGADETTPAAVVQLCIAAYFLLWVIFSSGILKRNSRGGSSNTPMAVHRSTRSRTRSRSRC